jgi:hypothetical protein
MKVAQSAFSAHRCVSGPSAARRQSWVVARCSAASSQRRIPARRIRARSRDRFTAEWVQYAGHRSHVMRKVSEGIVLGQATPRVWVGAMVSLHGTSHMISIAPNRTAQWILTSPRPVRRTSENPRGCSSMTNSIAAQPGYRDRCRTRRAGGPDPLATPGGPARAPQRRPRDPPANPFPHSPGGTIRPAGRTTASRRQAHIVAISKTTYVLTTAGCLDLGA